MIGFALSTNTLLKPSSRVVQTRGCSRRGKAAVVRMMSEDDSKGDVVQYGVIGASAIAVPVTTWSEYTLATTGSGLPDQFGLIEGLSYLAIVGLVGWSIYTKVRNREYVVVKRNERGEEVLRYSGKRRKFSRSETVVVEAIFMPKDYALTERVSVCQGDVMTEFFFRDRWYNVFRIESAGDRQLRGWYCNITRPAEVGASLVASDDLALDLVVAPDGECVILDEDEFKSLNLNSEETEKALSALRDLQSLVASRSEFFVDINYTG